MFFKNRKDKLAGQRIFQWALTNAQTTFSERFQSVSTNEIERLAKFEAISLYMAFAFWLLEKCELPLQRSVQAAQDAMFESFDGSLREQGVGDVRVGPYMRKLASAFYGRQQSYGEALNEADSKKLAEAMIRNQCCTDTEAKVLAEKICYEAQHIVLDSGVARWLTDNNIIPQAKAA